MSAPAINPSPSASGWSRLWPRRLGWRLGLGFGSLLALMLLALLLASWQMRTITDLTQRFATQDMQRLLRVQAMSLYIEGAGNSLLRLMLAPREQRVPEYARVDERARRIDGILESLSNSMEDLDQVQNLRRFKEARDAYGIAFLAFVDQIEAEDQAAALRVYYQQVEPSLKEMLVQSGGLIDRERERIERQMADAQAQLAQLVRGVAVLTLLSVLLAGVLAWRTTRSVVLPLAQLEGAAQRIAGGDYEHPALITQTEEVDRVGQALTRMTGAIAAREQEIERLAFRDPLTGLPNRTFLLNPATTPVEGRNCLMLMDLARLKTINETLGFVTGDTLIKEVASRATEVLEQAARDGRFSGSPALLCHLTGGRFAVLFAGPERAIAEQLRLALEQAMARPVHCSGHRVDLSLAYGLADSTDAQTPTPVITLMRNAEVALNAAKKATISFAWYSEAQEAARLSHLGLLSDLRLAVEESQLQMWLQPKFSLKNGRAVGAEALVRWQHPQRGFVSPAEFVPFAEQTGYISMVTNWMLDQALRTLAAWAPTQPELSIAVNMSTRDLLDPQFANRVQRMIEQHGVNPRCLRLEIVESGLMDDPTTSVAVLHRLSAMGIKLSIDDFGTGYSSLAYLQKLPVSELKIDRSFVDGVDGLPGTQRLVKAMVEMGHGMGLMVTAEGIETEAERDCIAALGCDGMRGYLGSRPLHGKAMSDWFQSL